MNDKKVSSDENFVGNDGLLNEVVKEDDNLFHVLVVPKTLSKYVA